MRKCEVGRIFIHRRVNIIPVSLLCVVTRFISAICISNTLASVLPSEALFLRGMLKYKCVTSKVSS